MISGANSGALPYTPPSLEKLALLQKPARRLRQPVRVGLNTAISHYYLDQGVLGNFARALWLIFHRLRRFFVIVFEFAVT